MKEKYWSKTEKWKQDKGSKERTKLVDRKYIFLKIKELYQNAWLGFDLKHT